MEKSGSLISDREIALAGWIQIQGRLKSLSLRTKARRASILLCLRRTALCGSRKKLATKFGRGVRRSGCISYIKRSVKFDRGGLQGVGPKDQACLIDRGKFWG